MTMQHHVTKLIHDLDLEQFSEDQQDQILAGILEAADKGVLNRLAEILTIEQQKHIASLTDEEALEAEIRKLVPNYDDILVEELESVKKDVLELMDAQAKAEAEHKHQDEPKK